MEQFYQLDPVRMERYEPYMTEWLKTYREDMSEMGWTAGLYVQRAIGTAMSKSATYPDSPLTLYEKPQRHEEDADAFANYLIHRYPTAIPMKTTNRRMGALKRKYDKKEVSQS